MHGSEHLTQNGMARLAVTRDTVFLFDIDGVLCKSQEKISGQMHSKLSQVARQHQVYFVTGNAYTKSVDLINGPIKDFCGVFCNSADELRTMRGKLVWQDAETQPIPPELEHTLYDMLTRRGYKHFGNRIEWRNPRSINFSVIGRNASMEERAVHDPSWRPEAAEFIESIYPNLEVSIGGSISLDICTRGANKSRACKYITGQGKNFIFFGDKTDIGGNDFPVKKFCEEYDKNLCLTMFGPEHTMNTLDSLLT